MAANVSCGVNTLIFSGIEIFNFLFILYLPTFPRSYRLGSKKREYKICCPPLTVAGYPGLNLLYIWINDSSVV